MNQPVRVEMLGRLVLYADGVEHSRFRSRQAASLLAYLAYFGHLQHSRERLADLFWPDSDPESGKLNLRVALNSLRKILEPPASRSGDVLIADRLNVALNPLAVTTDVRDFESSLLTTREGTESESTASLDRAVSFYSGTLLPGLHMDWVLQERERLSWSYFVAVCRLRDALSESEKLDEAITWARRAGTEQPYDEASHEALVRLLVKRRLHQEAKLEHVQFVERLKEELGLSPSPSLERLGQSLAGRIPESVESRQRPPQASKNTLKRRQSESLRPEGLLPLRLNRFFGRNTELALLSELLQSLDECRLVTVTGIGGCGKTRLAIEAAHQLGSSFPGGVWFVDLSSIAEPGLILQSVSAALGLRDRNEIVAALNRGRALLILDNLEHLLSEEPQASIEALSTVRELLQRVPQLSCLVTSRQRLEVDGEQNLPLQPLEIPDEDVDLPALVSLPSVALFADRARRVQPQFAVTRGNAASTAQLCRLLEGIPLAIELAASWSHSLSPRQMVERLEKKDLELVSRHRGNPPRHSSLRTVFDSSFASLHGSLQQFLVSLSVFRGGWTEEAATQVCEVENALAMLADLQARSLVDTYDSHGDRRFRMLETVREFAAKGVSPDQSSALCKRHSDYFQRLAATGAEHARDALQLEWLRRIEVEEGNIQAALAWSSAVDPSQALKSICDVADFWETNCRDDELMLWIERLLGDCAHEPGLTAVANYRLARLHTRNSRNGEAMAPAQIAIDLSRKAALETVEAMALIIWGIAVSAVSFASAREALNRAVEMTERLKLTAYVVDALVCLGYLNLVEGEPTQAKSLFERGLDLARDSQDYTVIPECILALCEVAQETGLYEDEAELARDALGLLSATGDKSLQPRALFLLGRALAGGGCVAEARRPLLRAVALYERVSLSRDHQVCRLTLADLDRATGRWESARAYYRQASETGREFGVVHLRAHLGLALVALNGQDIRGAAKELRTALDHEFKFRVVDILRCMEACQVCLSLAGIAAEANKLGTLVEGLRGRTGIVANPLDKSSYEEFLKENVPPLPTNEAVFQELLSIADKAKSLLPPDSLAET